MQSRIRTDNSSAAAESATNIGQPATGLVRSSQKAKLVYQGYFINLAKNEARRASLTRNLQEVGLADRYQRCDAVDGRTVVPSQPTKLDPGNLGLWLSHEKILETNPTPAGHLHIIEDDAMLSRDAAHAFEMMLNVADTRVVEWDLVFTDIYVAIQPEPVHQMIKQMESYAETKNQNLVSLARAQFASTSSMFINKASVGKYAGLISGKWTEGLPIDLYIRALVHHGLLKAFVTVPFLTSLSRESLQSDIRGTVDHSRSVFEVLRRSFFVDADHAALSVEMEELTRSAKVSPLANLFLSAERFMLSDQWVPF